MTRRFQDPKTNLKEFLELSTQTPPINFWLFAMTVFLEKKGGKELQMNSFHMKATIETTTLLQPLQQQTGRDCTAGLVPLGFIAMI